MSYFTYLIILFFLLLGVLHWKRIKQKEALIEKLKHSEQELLKNKILLTEEITEAKGYLSKTELKYQKLFNNSNDAIFVYQLDENGHPGLFVDVNDAAVIRMGYTREELLSLHLDDINTPENKPSIIGLLTQLKTKNNIIMDRVHVTKYGEKIPVEINATLFELDGEKTVISLARDLRYRLKAENAIKQSESKYHAMVENFDGLVYICSSDYKIQFMNRKLVERTGDNCIGMDCFKVLHDKDTRCEWCVNDRVMQGETVRWQLQSPKDHRWYDILNAPLYNADGTISKHAMITDITLQKKFESSLTDINTNLETRVKERTNHLQLAIQELEAFSFSVSHDLKEPLRVLNGYSQILLENYTDILDEDGKKHLDKISQSSVKISELIDALLNISHISRCTICVAPLDLSALATKILREKKESENDSLTKIEIEPNMMVNCDHKLLGITLNNLIDNAWKFTRKTPNPMIQIKSVQMENKTVYCIIDNGAGFNMAFATKLFVPFQRLHSHFDFPGAGVGLATAMRIIKRFGGNLWGEGQENVGATFYFTLNV